MHKKIKTLKLKKKDAQPESPVKHLLDLNRFEQKLAKLMKNERTIYNTFDERRDEYFLKNKKSFFVTRNSQSPKQQNSF